jgi:FMN-dependent NADH-azoreductase
MKLLEIQTSARQQGSISRLLSQEFLEIWQKNRSPIESSIEHKQRDVGSKPPAHITELWTKANYLAPEQRTSEMIEMLSESETLIEELF